MIQMSVINFFLPILLFCFHNKMPGISMLFALTLKRKSILYAVKSSCNNQETFLACSSQHIHDMMLKKIVTFQNLFNFFHVIYIYFLQETCFLHIATKDDIFTCIENNSYVLRVRCTSHMVIYDSIFILVYILEFF